MAQTQLAPRRASPASSTRARRAAGILTLNQLQINRPRPTGAVVIHLKLNGVTLFQVDARRL
jgi:hypothetical protein